MLQCHCDMAIIAPFFVVNRECL